MIQVDKSFVVNGRLVIAETMEDAIRIFRQYWKNFNNTDIEPTDVHAIRRNTSMYIDNDYVIYEIKD